MSDEVSEIVRDAIQRTIRFTTSAERLRALMTDITRATQSCLEVAKDDPEMAPELQVVADNLVAASEAIGRAQVFLGARLSAFTP